MSWSFLTPSLNNPYKIPMEILHYNIASEDCSFTHTGDTYTVPRRLVSDTEQECVRKCMQVMRNYSTWSDMDEYYIGLVSKKYGDKYPEYFV